MEYARCFLVDSFLIQRGTFINFISIFVKNFFFLFVPFPNAVF
jgi:hypothetical protein